MRYCLIFAVVAFSYFTANAQIVVQNSGDPAELATNLAFTSNLEVFNVTFSGDSNQFGLFNAENSNIPIDYGIVLGTGDVTNVIGPNLSTSSTLGGGNFGASDVDIELLVPGVYNDAAVLEFDFISTTDTSITIEFVFGSDEYNNYVCTQYTDGVGVFLSGPGFDGPFSNNAINLATVPGTGSPVSINSINSGAPGVYGDEATCFAADSLWMENSVYFYNNEIIPCPGETQLDGFTVTIANTAILVPGEVYHLKIVIADAADTSVDSAIFLKGISIEGCTNESALNFNPLAVTDDGLCEFAPALCEDLDAVNFGFEGTCCYSESAFELQELMGTWRLSPEYGGILVGPEPLNGDWFTGQAIGPQLDDQWTFFSNGALIFETNGTVMDPLNGYNESPLNFPLLGYDFETGTGAYGLGTLTLLNPIGQTCAFMGTRDSGPTYDVLQLGMDTLRLVSPIMNIPSCDINSIDPGFFTLTFVRTEFDSDVAGVCLWGCTNQSSPNFEPNAQFDNGNCIETGCTYPEALNYNPLAVVDNGNCQFAGCMDEAACNFNALANVDDGSCEACSDEFECAGDLDGDAMVSVTDLLILLGAFGNECEPAWSCGDPVNYHGYDYATVQIGDRCWFAENLRTEQYGNGDAVPQLQSAQDWLGASDSSTGGWANYDNDADYAMIHGKLYNGIAVEDARNICPTDWHVSVGSDWDAMLDAFGGDQMAGLALKNSETWDGTNSSGFNGLAGGFRDGGNANFYFSQTVGTWWTKDDATSQAVSTRRLVSGTDEVLQQNYGSNFGSSVRCVKDSQ